MRLFGFLGLVTLAAGAAGLAGCEDAKSAAVNDDLGWHVGCASGSSGCTLFPGRTQMSIDPKKSRDFKVECSIKGDEVSFTIKDPGVDPFESPPGSAPGYISVANGNPSRQSCNVTASDAMEAGYAGIIMRGTCMSSSLEGGCTLSRLPDEAGWDWVGTLQCDRLFRDNMPMPVYNLTGLIPGTPIRIALANCD